MAKKDNTIFWVIGAIIIAALMINSQTPKEEGMIGLTPHYYKDGVEVFPAKGLFSIVGGEGVYDQIAFDIFGDNTGNVDIINMQIVDAYPQVFKDALIPITPQTLNLGQTKKLWEPEDYSLINTAQFEGQTINFWVNISGEDIYGNKVYADVYSGDITFQSVESLGFVLFRTGDILYTRGLTDGGAIAYADSGYGEELTRYGYDAASATTDTCDEHYGANNMLIEQVPVSDGFSLDTSYTDQGDGDGQISLYRDGVKLVLCEDDTTGIGRSGYYRYSTTKTQGTVSLLPNSVDMNREVFFEPEPEGIYTEEHWYMSGVFAVAGGIATDGINIWFLDTWEGHIHKYDMNGNYIGRWLSGTGDWSSGIATDGINIWVCGDGAAEIYKFNMDGTYTNIHWDTAGNGNTYPKGLTTDGTNIWSVSGGDYNKIYKYDMNGNYINNWVATNNNDAHGITTDGTNIWVLDDGGNRVIKYDMNGNYINSWNITVANNDAQYIMTYGNYFWINDFNAGNDEVFKYTK